MNGSNRLIDRAQIHDLRVKGHDNLQVRRIRTQRNTWLQPVGANGRYACCIACCMLQASHRLRGVLYVWCCMLHFTRCT